ncbi:MAG TPA: LacI family DNA-binding transcriptional regulator [Kineosporiaceae bacterium]|nr:LacI family DNA-binding transcriptional regulator [Kineosporiaceae bacterium]
MSSNPAARAPRRRVTMAEVARLAGVSPTTVSFVINDRPNSGIPEETRVRVLTAVSELGYRPNRQARNLRLQRTHSLGFYVPEYMLDSHQHFALALFQPLLRAADQRGYQIVAFTGGTDVVGRFADMVEANMVDGFILTDSAIDDPRARYLAGAGVPFASLGRTAPELPQSWVDIDNAAAIGLMVDYLVERGHQQIAYAGKSLEQYWWREREAGFRTRMLHHGLAVRKPWVLNGAAEGNTSLARVLSAKNRPSAVITAGDSIAVSAYRASKAAGLKVGHDIAITGFDPPLWMLDPVLTNLNFPVEELAIALVERCLRELDEGPSDAPGEVIPTFILPGESA